MSPQDIEVFVNELEIVESFTTEITARLELLKNYGLEDVQSLPGFADTMRVLKDFDRRVHRFLESTRAIDNSLHASIAKIIEETALSSELAHLYVTLNVAAKKKKINFDIVKGVTITPFLQFISRPLLRDEQPFSKSSPSMQKILIAFHRLIPLARRVMEVHLLNWQQDDGVFKPSSINRYIVINYIEQAIISVQAATISPDQKAYLLAHLGQTKNELAGDEIPWKKVIGALIVVATILSGLADAPQAIENVRGALRHILGTSIEKLVPPTLPAPDLPTEMPHGPVNLA